jgi:hypothetical protein
MTVVWPDNVSRSDGVISQSLVTSFIYIQSLLELLLSICIHQYYD